MRALNTADLFKAMRLVEVSSVKEKLKPVLAKATEKGVDSTDIGIEAILSVAGALGGKETEAAFYDLLAGVFEMPQEDVANLDLDELIDKLTWMWEEGNAKGFFIRLFNMNTTK